MTSIAKVAPVTVFIPTYNRGALVLSVLEKVRSCDPQPAEILVHVDAANGTLECKLRRQFPDVKILTSSTRLGPGGGRHRCLVACNTPYAVSFDDDSYPVDRDFFSHIEPLFLRHPRAAIFGASIWHRCEAERPRIEEVVRVAIYTGCGYAVRLAAYRQVRGTLSLPVAYGMEETDLSIQLFAAGWQIYEAGLLRVLHDTDSKHHDSFEITAGAISNVGLFVFLHFPVIRWSSAFCESQTELLIRFARDGFAVYSPVSLKFRLFAINIGDLDDRLSGPL